MCPIILRRTCQRLGAAWLLRGLAGTLPHPDSHGTDFPAGIVGTSQQGARMHLRTSAGCPLAVPSGGTLPALSWGHCGVSVPCRWPLCPASPRSKPFRLSQCPWSLRRPGPVAALDLPGSPTLGVTRRPHLLTGGPVPPPPHPPDPGDTLSGLSLCKENSSCAPCPLGPEELFTHKLELGKY